MISASRAVYLLEAGEFLCLHGEDGLGPFVPLRSPLDGLLKDRLSVGQLLLPGSQCSLPGVEGALSSAELPLQVVEEAPRLGEHVAPARGRPEGAAGGTLGRPAHSFRLGGDFGGVVGRGALANDHGALAGFFFRRWGLRRWGPPGLAVVVGAGLDLPLIRRDGGSPRWRAGALLSSRGSVAGAPSCLRDLLSRGRLDTVGPSPQILRP